MGVLFDNGVPRGIASVLEGHTVEEARDRGWDRLKNGDLLDAAEAQGFDVFVTTDRNLRYQQNLSKRTLAIVGLSKGSWPLIKRQLSDIASAVAAAVPGSVTEVASERSNVGLSRATLLMVYDSDSRAGENVVWQIPGRTRFSDTAQTPSQALLRRTR